ncbi:oligosaccharide flippase family protein [Salmonella enterica]|nr:flippase [Salmonella enterica]EAY2065750.1 flippase [Salmonella enterica]EBO3988613.1 flippase [Salmonella enterica]EHD9853005.1 oligosaccharide flippase family protein [Salmonella enterica]EIG7225299.1 oligosaccharide flippase family protein [Salmonella enterica]
MASTKKNILYLAISQGSNYLLPLLIYPVIIRAIGINAFGKVTFAIVIMQMFFLIIDFGFGYSATKHVALNYRNKVFLSHYFAKITAARFLFFTGTVVILFIGLLVPPLNEIRNLLFIAMIAVFFNIINPNWFLQGLGMMKIMAINSLISRGISIVLIYLSIKWINNIYYIIVVLVFPYIYYSFASFLFVLKKGYIVLYKPKIHEVLDVIKDSAYFFFSTLATSAYTMLTPIILGSISGTVSLGIFNSANLIKQGFAGLISPIIQAFYPKVNVVYKEEPSNARRLVYKLLLCIVFLFSLASLPFVLFSSEIASLLFGNKAGDILETLRLMSFLPLLIAINSIVGLLILVPEGENKKYFNVIISGGIVCLLSVYPLCFYYGASGAAISLIIAEIVVFLGMIKYLIKGSVWTKRK